MARLVRRTARLLGALAVLILIALAALHLPWVRQRVLDRARAYAERELGVAVGVSRLDYNLFTRTIEVHGVVLASRSAPDPFLEADQVVVVLSPALLRGQLAIDEVLLRRPRLSVVRYANGTSNLPASKSDGARDGPLELGLVSVTAFSARLDDRASQRSFSVGPLDLSMNVGAASTNRGVIGPGAFTVNAGPIQTTGTIGGRVAFDGRRLEVEELITETREGRVVVDGWADLIGDRPAIAARARAVVDAAQAARLAGAGLGGLGGQVDVTADVTGEVAAPTVTVGVASRDASYAPVGPVQLSGRMTLRASTAGIESVEVVSGLGSLQAQGTVQLAEVPAGGAAQPPSRISLQWRDVRVDDLASVFGQALPVRTGSIATGSATSDFTLSDVQARAWSRPRFEAATTMQRATTGPRAGELGLTGTATLALDKGAWSLRHALRAEGADVRLAGTVTGRLLEGSGLRSTLGGRTQVSALNVALLPPLLRSVGISIPALATDGLGGTALANVAVAGTVERPIARIDLDARDLRATALPHPATIDARLVVEGGSVTADQLNATVGTASLRAMGRYTSGGAFDGTFDLRERDLSSVAGWATLPVAVNGSAQAEGRIVGAISGAARRGQATVSLSASDLVIDQVPIGQLTANGTIPLAEGALITVAATAPDIGVRADVQVLNRDGYPISGEVSLDNRNVGALVPPAYRDRIGDIAGRLSATAHGSGQLADPGGIRGSVTLRAVDLTARGTTLTLTEPATVVVTEDRVAVQSLDLRVGERIRLTAAGQLGATAIPDPLRLRLEGPLAELVETGTRIAAVQPVEAKGEGSVTLDLTVEGTLARPQPIGVFTLRSPSLQYGTLAPLTGLNLDATIDPAVIILRSAVAQWQGATVRAEGAVPWRVILDSVGAPVDPGAPPSRLAQWRNSLPAEPARARLNLRVDDVTEAMLRDLAGPARLDEVKAIVAATVVADTDRFTLDRVQATAVLERATLTLAGVPFTQSVPTRISLQKGRASIDDFRWTAEGHSIVATGAADLTGTQPSVDLGVAGAVDLRVLGAFASGLASGGTAEADLKVTGPPASPEIVGRITVADGELQVDRPRLSASEFKGAVQLAPGRKATIALTGLVNTGHATIEGTLDLANLAAPTGHAHLVARGVAMEYPPGFQTESNVDLDLVLGAVSSTLTGRVDVLAGTYREPIVLTSQLLNLSATTGVARTAPPADWLSRLRLNLAVASSSDVRIDNNYGRFDVGATLRVVGTAASPGVLGRLQAAEDGEIFLGGNTYRIQRLEIDLANPRSITPEVSFAAQTRIGDLPINIDLQCPANGPCERKVTSLATGVDDAEAEARLFGTAGGVGTAGEGLARLLSGEILGVVGRTVGLDAIRLEQEAQRRDIFDDPTLISGDVDPATRLTLAKRVGPNVELVFSQNLADDGFTWSTTYTAPYGLSWRLLLLDDESRAYEFRHELGGRMRQPARQRGQRIAGVTISGTPGFPERDLRSQLRLGEGDEFRFGEWQRDRDRLADFYHSRGYLEARIRARRVTGPVTQTPAAGGASEPTQGGIGLEYVVARGPVTHLVVKGGTLPGEIRDRIASRWTSALFDGFLERDARTLVRDHLYRSGYLSATVTTAMARDPSGDSKTLTIDIATGPTLTSRIETAGNAALPTGQLVGLITAADPLSPWLDPSSVERLLEDHYRSQGFLEADVSIGTPEQRDGSSVVTIEVAEGPPYSIGRVELSGVPEGPGSDVRDELALAQGDRYRPAEVSAGVDRMAARLRRAAYRQARTEIETRVDDKAAVVDIAVRVSAGPRSVLQNVVVEGADAEAPAVARALALVPGEPLDSAAIGETRRRLYDLDVYRSVDIDVQPVQAVAATDAAAVSEQPVVARITLAERPRYRFRYGLALSDEPIGADERDRRLGFAADLERRNLFDRGLTAGLSARLRRDQQVGRLTLGARRFFGLPIRSTLFIEREREQLNPDGAAPITSDISSFTGEQAYRVRRSIELRYGYGIERNHTFIRDQVTDPFDLTVTVARFSTSALVDRRDDPFDPGHGWFTASTLELSAPRLGSDLRFLKNFAQYSRFDPFGSSVVVASAARLGLARTFEGEVLIPSERFFAGGATSVRGYREDDLGARSVFDDAEGGSALLVLNGELRFRIYRWLKGVGFVDLGNVYPTASDLSLGDLQIGLGAGARFDTPFGLFRLDLGVPANRRSFDPRWRVHFGLGHAF